MSAESIAQLAARFELEAEVERLRKQLKEAEAEIERLLRMLRGSGQ